MRQVSTKWTCDENGVLSREIFAEEVSEISPRDELNKLRLRLANSEHVPALQGVQAAANALAERCDEDLKADVRGLLDRCKAKLLRAEAP